ncbi:glycosyltransferase [Nigerium massiliense]|uniref:glycosyltransferase n=1 Tax=Nigerium massiliense TaxID=1522317 RepID=UPI000AEB967E|nr:glycosyltransferase [Nigerium massiliense]
MRKLRLAFVSMHTSPADQPGAGDAGGMNVVESQQAMALAAMGHSVELITRRANPDSPDVMELAPGVTLRHLDAGPARPLAKSAIDAYCADFAEELSRLEPPDLVHSHHWMSGVSALEVAHTWGVPHVQSYHSVAALPGSPLGDGEPPESPARVPGEAMTARLSDAIVAVSTAEARTVIERCGADPRRVFVTTPGVDSEVFRPASPTEARPDEAWAQHPNGYALFAARLQPLKGPDLAIASIAAVSRRLRPHLVIAGDISEDFKAYRADLDRMIDTLGLTGSVTFVGGQPREQLARLMRHCEVFMVPSHSETFGLVALEAAASGVPVISSAAGGLREVVVDEETGLLMKTRQPSAWASGLSRMLADDELRARMGTVARVHARRFTWNDAARRLSELYLTLVDR